MSRIVSVLICIAVVYLSVCGAFYVRQSKLVYFPSRLARVTPADVGLVYDDLTLRTDDGVRLAAWAVGAGDNPWIIYCHGNGGNMSDRLGTLQALRGLGVSVLMFDYRGYGRSEGEPSEAGLYRDAEAAWRWLTETRRVSPGDVVIWGESLGGGVATWLAVQHPPRALVLQSTFTSVPDVGAPVYWWLPVRLLCEHVYASIDRIGRLRCPVLHTHAPDDDLIPYAVGRRLYAAGNGQSTWIDTVGGHNAGMDLQSPEVRARVRRFIEAPREAIAP